MRPKRFLAVAPGNYAETEAASEALERIREHVRKSPLQTLHQTGMLLWASSEVNGLMDDARRQEAVRNLLETQREDGGWSVGEINAGWPRFDMAKIGGDWGSAPYGTAFVIHALRKAGVPASDERSVAWLKANQRESGRWFVPSFNNRPNSVLTYSATAYAILALEACGELAEASEPNLA